MNGLNMSQLNVSQLSGTAALVLNWASVFLPRLAAACILLIAGLAVAGWIARIMKRVLATSHVDPTLKPVLVSITRYAVLGLVLLLSLEQLGVQTTSLLAVLGAAGLAIGLALQGTLSNIAAGLMLLWLRPFRVGDFVEVPTVGGLSGKVREIGLFTCILDTAEGLFLFVPNSAIWNAPLRNYTHNNARLLALSLTFSAAADRKKVQEAILDVVRKDEHVLSQPAPMTVIESSASDATTLTLACWALPGRISAAQKSLIDGLEIDLAAIGREYAPSKVARFLPADNDPSRFNSDVIGAGGGGARQCASYRNTLLF